MTQCYFRMRKALFLILIALCSYSQGKAQTDLVPGDLLFTSYNSNASTTDGFSFVVLKSLTNGTVISFTDNAWLPTNVLRTGEQTLTWTTNGPIQAGREITISGPSAGAPVARQSGAGIVGTCTGAMLSFATSGDQVIAYQVKTGVTTPIAGMHMNVYSTDLGQCGNTTAAAWDPTCITDNANYSVMPQGLSPTTSAMWIGTEGVGASEQDNARFSCSGPLATAAEVRSSVLNQANWAANSVAPPDVTVAGASNCVFLGVPLPVDLRSFSGSCLGDYIQLQWQTANEMNHSHFEVEKSGDGLHFSTLERVIADGGFSYLVHNYEFKDDAPLKGTNYYRLKLVGTDGSARHTQVVRVEYRNNNGRSVLISPNPALTEVIVAAPDQGYDRICISDLTGRVVLQEAMEGRSRKLDISRLVPGRYIITVTGTSEKVTGQLVITH